MADDFALTCSDLSKRYRVKAPGGKQRWRSAKEDFYALRDVNFEIPKGQIVGIVGRNGAGKSTLLKILSRIVAPSTGSIVLNGRLAGLLEVGTGFNMELTGRENVYLNGTVMGMTHREVLSQFDSIVDFAGISYFLDTPVKRYSSGMYVRLAFAVAAHLRSEILILDEVLAVGDAAFQRKCLSKVNELSADEGRTVLLVSHNAKVIRESATMAMRLERGHLTTVGSVDEVLNEAEDREIRPAADLTKFDRPDVNFGREARITRAEVMNDGRVSFGGDLRYRLSFKVNRRLELGVSQTVVTLDDTPLAASFSGMRRYEPGEHTVEVVVPNTSLAPGNYALHVVLGQSSFEVPDLNFDVVLRAVGFTIVDDDMLVAWRPEWWGNFALPTPMVSPE